MRLAIVTTSYPSDERHDAEGHFVRTEARLSRAEGHDVTVIAPGFRGALAPLSTNEPPCVRLGGGEAFGWPGALPRLRQNPLRAASAGAWLSRVRGHLRAHAYDRVVVHWAFPTAWVVPAEESTELIVVSHGADVRLLTRMPAVMRERFVRQLAGRARAWKFVSQALLETLCGLLRSEAREALARVAAIEPSPIEVTDVSPCGDVVRQTGPCQETVLASVGRLIASKRVDAAIAHVRDVEPRATLVIIGEGPERVRLEQLAREWSVDARFLGLLPRRDALGWVKRADGLLQASREEGLSTVVREALALGTRVIYV